MQDEPNEFKQTPQEFVEAKLREPEPRVTKRDLAERGLGALPDAVGDMEVSRIAGGVSFATATEVMNFAKLMAVAGKAVPPWLRNNPGSCLAITFQAVEWRMSPFQVANKSYEVNDRVAFESQLVHAVVEARAPLKERLDCRYEGEGGDRICTVIGMFKEGSVRSYTSPPIKEIRVKNSPLWTSDPDQQLFYFASRAWARKWVPDVLLGIYTPEEAETIEPPPQGSGLVERLVTSNVTRDEGFKAGFAEAELEQITPGKRAIAARKDLEAAEAEAHAEADKATQRARDSRRRVRKGKPSRTPARTQIKPAKPAKAAKAEPQPKPPAPASRGRQQPPANFAQYRSYFIGWLDGMDDADEIRERWKSERALRNRANITQEERLPLEAMLKEKMEALSGH